MTSAAFSARTAFSVKSSGSPGPAPTRSTRPCTACAFTAASIASPTRRRASLSSPASAAGPAAPSNTPSQNLRRGRPAGSFSATASRKSPARRASASSRGQQLALEPGTQTLREHRRGALGADRHRDLAAIDDGRHAKLHKAGWSGTLTGTPRARAIAAKRASSSSSSVAAITNAGRHAIDRRRAALRDERHGRRAEARQVPARPSAAISTDAARFSKSRAFMAASSPPPVTNGGLRSKLTKMGKVRIGAILPPQGARPAYRPGSQAQARLRARRAPWT